MTTRPPPDRLAQLGSTRLPPQVGRPRMPLILGWGHILQICQVIVLAVAIQVIYLPAERIWWRTQKGCSHQPMHMVEVVCNTYPAVPCAAKAAKMNSAGGSRNTAVRAHLPTARSTSRLQHARWRKPEKTQSERLHASYVTCCRTCLRPRLPDSGRSQQF